MTKIQKYAPKTRLTTVKGPRYTPQMRPYGMTPIKWPDVADIQEMAAKSSTGRFREKGGDFKSYSRKIKKRRNRILQRRRARRAAKIDIDMRIQDA